MEFTKSKLPTSQDCLRTLEINQIEIVLSPLPHLRKGRGLSLKRNCASHFNLNMFSLASLNRFAFIVTGKDFKGHRVSTKPCHYTNNYSLKGDNDSQMTMHQYNFLLQMFCYNSLLEDGEQYRNMAVCMDKHNFAYCNYCSQSCYILSSRIVTTHKKLCFLQ